MLIDIQVKKCFFQWKNVIMIKFFLVLFSFLYITGCSTISDYLISYQGIDTKTTYSVKKIDENKQYVSIKEDIINYVNDSGKDIILEHFETQLLNGNWDSEIYFETFPRIRFIQEDEYDQHMGENPPEYDFFLASWYIVIDKD